MITHYLKVALRNLLKYKTQSFISMLGLAVGFASIALSVYWNHYEMSYDSFHPNSERIYRIRNISRFTKDVSHITPGPLAAYLKEHYPEVEKACALNNTAFYHYKDGDKELPRIKGIRMTPDGADMFHFEWLEGNGNVASWTLQQIALSDKVAKEIWGSESPVGKKLTYGQSTLEVVALFKAWPDHSNFDVGFVCRQEVDDQWNAASYYTYAMLRENADARLFMEKMKSDTITTAASELFGVGKFLFDVVTPLEAMRYTYPEAEINVRLEDVRLFTMAAVLLSLCALLNYLTLFVNRLRYRGRNLALRTVCGASGGQLGLMLMTEYLLLFLGAWFFGMLLVEVVMPFFFELSSVTPDRMAVYSACGWFILFVIACAGVLSFVPIRYFRKQVLYAQIHASQVAMWRQRFGGFSMCVQFFVSILFLFCSIVMMKQVYFLTHSDLNIHRKQIACMQMPNWDVTQINRLKALPMITEAMNVYEPLFPFGGGSTHNTAGEWDGKSEAQNPIPYRLFRLNDSIARFYGLQMKEGPQSFDLGENEIIINERLAKDLNMEHPVGKTLNSLRIKGVMYDYHPDAPTVPVSAYGFMNTDQPPYYIIFKYSGDFAACREAIEKTFGKSARQLWLKDGEETYQGYLKSERNLLKLLACVTVVSILISLFGIYAMMVQACERYRKQIAIRKVNGAQVWDILGMFLKQYLVQVALASVLAFPVGYVLMKRWLESYIRQTDISAWIYLSILVGVSLLVVLCIGWRVWKAATENPAKVIKSE